MNPRIRARLLEAADAKVRAAAERLGDARAQADAARGTAQRAWRDLHEEARTRTEALRSATDVLWASRAEAAARGRSRVQVELLAARDADARAEGCEARSEEARAELARSLVRVRGLGRVLRIRSPRPAG